MKHVLPLALVAVVTGSAGAQDPSCQVPSYYGNGCAPSCAPTCPVPCKPRGQESAPKPTEGAFIGGPQGGETAGEANSLGLRMGSIRIPAVTIPLPTIQLPSLVRFRRDAERLTESASLPFVEGPVTQFGLRPERGQESAPLPGGEESAPGGCSPYCPPCASADQQRLNQLTQQISELNAAVSQLAAMQRGGIQATSYERGASEPLPRLEPAVPVRAVSQAAEPSRDMPNEELLQLREELTRQAQAQNDVYATKCRELEELRDQLSTTQMQYQQLLETRLNDVYRQREERLRAKHFAPSAEIAGQGSASDAGPATALENETSAEVPIVRGQSSDVGRSSLESRNVQKTPGPVKRPWHLR